MEINKSNSVSAVEISLRIFSILLIAGFFVFSGLVFNSGRSRDKAALADYVDIEDGFTMKYPKDWRIEKSNTSDTKSKNQTLVSFTNPVGDIENNFLGSANITVFFDYSESQANLEVFKNIVKSDMAHGLDGFSVIKEEKAVFNNLEGYVILASDNGPKSDGSGPKPLFRSLIFVTTEQKSNREFLVWAAAFEGNWDKYKSLFKRCLESFKIPQ